jgi:hypothetical protein
MNSELSTPLAHHQQPLRPISNPPSHTPNIKTITEWEVYTPSGWQPFDGVKKTVKAGSDAYHIKVATESGKMIECSGGHQLLVQTDDYSEPEFLVANMLLMLAEYGTDLLPALVTKTGLETIASVEKVVNSTGPSQVEFYDLVNVGNGFKYYSNGVVSHNCAHIDNFDVLWTGLFSTLSTGGKAILFSTPRGRGMFYNLWQGAETKETEQNKAGIIYKGEGKNGFHAIKLPWTVHPERGQDWFEEQCAALDDRGVAQELLCSFEGSSTSFFNDESIQYIRSSMIHPALTIPIMVASKNTGEAHVWKTPVPGHEYVLSADIARGDAEDFSTFYIFDTTTSEAVVEYRGKLPPDRYATVLDEWGRKYNMAKVAIELNNTGLSTSIALKNLKYPNLYYPPEIEERLVSMTEDEKASVYPGLTIGSDNRDRILQFMEQNIRSRKVRIFSERFLGEMETFIWNGKRGQAQKKRHDDLIMAAAIGMQMFSPNADLPSMFAASSGNASALATAMLAGMGRSSTPGGIKRVGYARFAANTTSKQSLENEMLLRKEFGWLYKQ